MIMNIYSLITGGEQTPISTVPTVIEVGPLKTISYLVNLLQGILYGLSP